MQNTIDLRKNLVSFFIVTVIVYLFFSLMFYRPAVTPLILKTTTDTVCYSKEDYQLLVRNKID